MGLAHLVLTTWQSMGQALSCSGDLGRRLASTPDFYESQLGPILNEDDINKHRSLAKKDCSHLDTYFDKLSKAGFAGAGCTLAAAFGLDLGGWPFSPDMLTLLKTITDPEISADKIGVVGLSWSFALIALGQLYAIASQRAYHYQYEAERNFYQRQL